jgi:hypothetical protein
MVAVGPVTAIDCRATTVMERVWLVDPFRTPTVAVPAATAVTSPEALTVSTVGLLELQADVVVIFWVVPPLAVPVAVSCSVEPASIVVVAAAIAIELKAGCGQFGIDCVSQPAKSKHTDASAAIGAFRLPIFSSLPGR